jgi:hypothetical protein
MSSKWKLVYDRESLGMLQSPDGRIFRIQQLGKDKKMWGSADDNDDLIEEIANALVFFDAYPLFIKAVEAAIEYDNAIKRYAAKGEGKSWVEGDDLDALYAEWIGAAKQAVAERS